MTFLAALRHDRIDAPWFIEGPIDGESFRTYVAKVLLPTLRPGDIVVMDNLGSHKGKAVRQLIRSVGAKLFFLPKYSPDLNPIEQVFAKLKHLLRRAAARTVDAVCAAISRSPPCVHARRVRQLSPKLRLSNLISSRLAVPGQRDLINGDQHLEQDQEHDDHLQPQRAAGIDDIGQHLRGLGDHGKFAIERFGAFLELVFILSRA